MFICIEGLDASGKTTQAHRLVENLRSRGFDAVFTTEPSRGEIGTFIRKNILQRGKRVPSVVETIFFAIDRIDHLERKIKPDLQKRKIVVSDRYIFSSLAYQGSTGLDMNWIEEINKLAIPPSLSIYIDVQPEVVMKRLGRRRSVMEKVGVQRKVRHIYMKLVKNKRLVLIDGNKTANEVSKEIFKIVFERLSSSFSAFKVK